MGLDSQRDILDNLYLVGEKEPNALSDILYLMLSDPFDIHFVCKKQGTTD